MGLMQYMGGIATGGTKNPLLGPGGQFLAKNPMAAVSPLGYLLTRKNKKDATLQEFAASDAEQAQVAQNYGAPAGAAPAPRAPMQLADPLSPFQRGVAPVNRPMTLAPAPSPAAGPAPLPQAPQFDPSEYFARIANGKKSQRKAALSEFVQFLKANPNIRDRGRLYLVAKKIAK